MARDRTEIERQALDWVIRLRAPDFDDWDAFGEWMATDPDHAEIYHEMAIADQDMAEILASPQPKPIAPKPILAPDPRSEPVRRRPGRRMWIGGAVAASLAALIAIQVVDRQPSFHGIETRPGERRIVQLAEGSTVTLNGGTRVTIDKDDPRHVGLDHGEAVFAVVHDEARPFTVTVGGSTLLDVGTRFNVVRDAGVTAVQVSEGAVVYDPSAQAIRLNPGQTLRVADGQAATIGHVRPTEVAGWETGQLVYDARPIGDVAADLTRWSGRIVHVSPLLAGRRFSGAIDLRSVHDVAELAPLLDVKIDKAGDGWTLSPRT